MDNQFQYTPRTVENFEAIGSSGHFSLPGEQCQVIRKASLTSFDVRFNNLATSVANMVGCAPSSLNQLLVLVGKDKVARIYESFPMSMQVVAKRDIKAGMTVFDSDIADIREVNFSDAVATISPEDGEKIIWIFRDGFSFGMYFDLTEELVKSELPTNLAHTYLQTRYFNLYQTLSNESIKDVLEYGWFPFIQLLGKDFESIHSIISRGIIEKIPNWVELEFPQERVKKFTNGWWLNSVFAKKKSILAEGLDCFFNKQYSACISTLTPMVEGIANSHYQQATGKGIKYDGNSITQAITSISTSKFSQSSLTFPHLFEAYLETYFFKNTRSSTSKASTRNTVSHGRAEPESFTQENALKTILTLDQIRFYMTSNGN